MDGSDQQSNRIHRRTYYGGYHRRLTLAARELITENVKVIDVAIKYCYDSPDSFTKAFCRFHGATPSMVQKNHTMMKSFAPLKINYHWKVVIR